MGKGDGEITGNLTNTTTEYHHPVHQVGTNPTERNTNEISTAGQLQHHQFMEMMEKHEKQEHERGSHVGSPIKKYNPLKS